MKSPSASFQLDGFVKSEQQGGYPEVKLLSVGYFHKKYVKKVNSIHMQTKSKPSFLGLFLFALVPFYGGLRAIAHSMAYSGVEHNFIADNWIFPSTLLITLLFALSWWTGSLVEHLLLKDKRKSGIFTSLSILAVAGVVGSSSVLVSGFTRSIVEASAGMIFCGFFFRFSVICSETIDKLREQN